MVGYFLRVSLSLGHSNVLFDWGEVTHCDRNTNDSCVLLSALGPGARGAGMSYSWWWVGVKVASARCLSCEAHSCLCSAKVSGEVL